MSTESWPYLFASDLELIENRTFDGHTLDRPAAPASVRKHGENAVVRIGRSRGSRMVSP